MAPAKRKADKQAEEAEPAQPTTLPPARVTRAAAKRAATTAAASTGPPALAELPVKKSKKAKGTEKKKKKEEEEAEEKVDDAVSETEEGDSTAANGVDASKIIIEHCKQCNSFKTRANQVKAGLEKTAGITVIANPEKPRRGCFEIREEGGKKFISLLDMKRPFTPMKNLDMDKVISDIIDEISTTG